MFIIPVREYGSSTYSNFKHTCKIATLFKLTSKCCFELILSCIDNQHLFLQYHTAILIPASGSMMD